jgi:hypothetical protein
MFDFDSFEVVAQKANCAHSTACPNDKNPKNTMPLQVMLCCDSRGDGCCYLQVLNWQTEHRNVSLRLCMYKFAMNSSDERKSRIEKEF